MITSNIGLWCHLPRHWLIIGAMLGCLSYASAATADPAPATKAYALAPGDRIIVNVFGQQDLSGELMIDGAGNLVLPLVGAVRVENLSIAEAQELVQNRLADGFLKRPVVSIRIAQLRPVYVLGDVRVPGTFPFQFGNTVASAIALAGGFGMSGVPRSAAIAEFMSADERVGQLTFEQTASRIREARLDAQRDGGEPLFPPDLPANGRLAELIASEKAILAAQRAILGKQVDLLESQKPRLKNEIDTVNGQIAAASQHLAFVRNEVKRSTQLASQGLGIRDSAVHMEFQVVNEESNVWRMTNEILRLQREMAEIDIKIQDAKATYQKQLLAELERLHQRLAQLDLELSSARKIRNFKLELADGNTDQPPEHSFSITRVKGGKVVLIPGTEATLIEPGDVIDIKRAAPDRVARLAGPDGGIR